MTQINGLAFFDLDGTLLNEHSEVTPDIIKALQKMQQKGIIPIIATGRTNIEIASLMEETGIKSCITMNGQYVLFEGKEVYSSLIDPETCRRIHLKTQELGQEIGFYNHQNIRVSNHTELVKKSYDFIHSDMPEIDTTFYEKEPINMVLIIDEEHDSHYHQAFSDLTFFRNGPFTIDVIQGGGSKGKGVEELVKALGTPNLPTYAFGDGPNDIDLFHACQHRIAMGNAKDELKNIATYITGKNTKGGIIQALQHFNLI